MKKNEKTTPLHLMDTFPSTVPALEPDDPKRFRYVALGTKIGSIVADKNRQYGDSFGRSGDMLRILYPNGIQPDQYDEALAVTRIIDKLFRIANRIFWTVTLSSVFRVIVAEYHLDPRWTAVAILAPVGVGYYFWQKRKEKNNLPRG